MENRDDPYSSLDPSLMMNAIESVGYRCDGRFLTLNSYENRVFQIGIDDGPPIIAKFYRPHRWSYDAIMEEHQFALDLATEEIPVVAPIRDDNGNTLHRYADFLFALYPCKGGRTIELDRLDHLAWMGRFIGRIHAFGKLRSFQHRAELNVDSYGYQPYRFLVEHEFIPQSIQNNFCPIIESLLDKIALRYKAVGSISTIRLHGDCHAGNILWDLDKPHIVDFDDCLTGPAIQDLWMLLASEPELQQVQINTILEGYTEFNDFNRDELYLIEALRSLRMIHYNAWLAKRWHDSAFPRSFPWFNTETYWQQQLMHFQEQLTLF